MKRYVGEAYWLKEQPLEARTIRLAIAYYPKAGRLQIAHYHIEGDTIRRNRVVTLAREDLARNPEAKQLLLKALREL
ncbi:hypothetical protein EDD75_1376 [Thermodesulfitimonas autotrophica]|uniref:Uncharacterized protein n=1 Tax=Thermodesulfitimonas autotrophica TaxID=1894989 RepID=A0A3N5AQE2_9THEO|nr:hypothetical protein [Thermodesulfitimonas autotrophica]RPF47103.1 hypothetical protein EDD75_1376 [Thermodesulfitimonas autotrophica]